MALKPKKHLSDEEIRTGLSMVIWDGLAAEVMIAFTGSTFLTAMAIMLGASNIQIGLLASMPTLTNISQLISILLVRKFNNRRAIAVYCAYLARLPLILAGSIILMIHRPSIELLLAFLFFHYFFGSIAGPSWNSWMKDLVPEKMLGSYFSRRTRYTQTLNVILSLLLAFLLDYVRKAYPEYELATYAVFFILAGIIGIVGGYLLSRAPEHKSKLSDANLLNLFMHPLNNRNFRRLLIFNSAWVFAINIGAPFFSVFMLKGLNLPISYIIFFNVLAQISGILTLRVWGTFSDRYSNKSIIALSAPIYIACFIAWCFVGLSNHTYMNLILLAGIHIFSGIGTAGVNLSLTNMGLKLAPKEDAIVFLSVKNIVTALFSSIAPIIGGLMADYFSEIRVTLSVQWHSPGFDKMISLLSLNEWNFLFLVSATLGIVTMELLIHIKEVGEVDKRMVKRIMQASFRKNLKEYFIVGDIIRWYDEFRLMRLRKKSKKQRRVSENLF